MDRVSIHNNVHMYTQKIVQISNIVSRSKAVQESISNLCQSVNWEEGQSWHDRPSLVSLHDRIQKTAAQITGSLQERDAHAAHLPVRSRRAFQWLLFLASPNHFHQHLKAVSYLYHTFDHLSRSNLQNRPEPQITLYVIGPLYRIQRVEKDRLKITIHESFLAARPAVQQSLLQIALDIKEREAKTAIRKFTTSPTFARLREHLEYIGIPPHSTTRGKHKDLLRSFQRVNECYFDNGLSLPHLVWSKRLTYRKFGHYQEDTDTVLISRSLDSPDISNSTLDYVMFHELLHKELGSKHSNGRRYSHTKGFQAQEATYQGIQEAKSALKSISRDLSPQT